MKILDKLVFKITTMTPAMAYHFQGMSIQQWRISTLISAAVLVLGMALIGPIVKKVLVENEFVQIVEQTRNYANNEKEVLAQVTGTQVFIKSLESYDTISLYKQDPEHFLSTLKRLTKENPTASVLDNSAKMTQEIDRYLEIVTDFETRKDIYQENLKNINANDISLFLSNLPSSINEGNLEEWKILVDGMNPYLKQKNTIYTKGTINGNPVEGVVAGSLSQFSLGSRSNASTLDPKTDGLNILDIYNHREFMEKIDGNLSLFELLTAAAISLTLAIYIALILKQSAKFSIIEFEAEEKAKEEKRDKEELDKATRKEQAFEEGYIFAEADVKRTQEEISLIQQQIDDINPVQLLEEVRQIELSMISSNKFESDDYKLSKDIAETEEEIKNEKMNLRLSKFSIENNKTDVEQKLAVLEEKLESLNTQRKELNDSQRSQDLKLRDAKKAEEAAKPALDELYKELATANVALEAYQKAFDLANNKLDTNRKLIEKLSKKLNIEVCEAFVDEFEEDFEAEETKV